MSDQPAPQPTIKVIHTPVAPVVAGPDYVPEDLKIEMAQRYPCPHDGTACAMMIAPGGTRNYDRCRRECEQEIVDRWKAGTR